MGVYAVKTVVLGCLFTKVLVGVAVESRPLNATVVHGTEIDTPYCQFIQTCVFDSAPLQAQFIESPPQPDGPSHIFTA